MDFMNSFTQLKSIPYWTSRSTVKEIHVETGFASFTSSCDQLKIIRNSLAASVTIILFLADIFHSSSDTP